MLFPPTPYSLSTFSFAFSTIVISTTNATLRLLHPPLPPTKKNNNNIRCSRTKIYKCPLFLGHSTQ